MKKCLLSVWALIVTGMQLYAQSPTVLTVKADKPTATVQPTMWGIFFEDINLGADGGIYAELVKNRSFEFNAPMMGWKEQKEGEAFGSTLVENRLEKGATNPRYIHVTANSDKGKYGLINEGFRGMGIKQGETYDFSVWTRKTDASNLTLHIELINTKGDVIGKADLTPTDKDWKKQAVSLTATATDPKAKLAVWFIGAGNLDLDMVSLFPKNTWKQRPNGLRADLVQLLADMKPGFLRFPGGCIVEGRELSTRYQWKKTVGDVESREMVINRWNTEFKHRPTPDYFQTFGLGFYEYFLLAEDIGAEPLPILNCGMACQFNSAEVVPMSEIDPFIQDALDLIEFANGSTDTKWGKLRADMGHPKPFNLKLLGVGNEQWGPQYLERLPLFTKAIKEKYPTIKLVNSSGTDPNGERFDYLNKNLRSMNVDIIDEHYYRAPDWFLQNAHRYDNYDRNGPKIFAGEYAAQSIATVSPDNKNNWKCALAEAAFMTGLERNADVVHMASYAPLFAHAEGWQWTPDLIWFDNLRSYGTPNYYVQKLYSIHKGTQVVPLVEKNETVAGQNGLYASSVLDKNTQELVVKIVNTSDKSQITNILIESTKKVGKTGKLWVLKSESLESVNSFEDPTLVSPAQQSVNLKGKQLNLTVTPNSFFVVRVKLS